MYIDLVLALTWESIAHMRCSHSSGLEDGEASHAWTVFPCFYIHGHKDHKKNIFLQALMNDL